MHLPHLGLFHSMFRDWLRGGHFLLMTLVVILSLFSQMAVTQHSSACFVMKMPVESYLVF